MYTRQNKNTTARVSAQQNNAAASGAVPLKDNRPRSIFQAKALAEPSGSFLRGSGAPVQRTISFKIGNQKAFRDVAHLKAVLKGMFAADHHARIDELVDDADLPERGAISVGHVYDHISKTTAVKENWVRSDTSTKSSGHGPVIPFKDSKGVGDAKQSTMSGFMMGSVTLLSAQLILPNKKLKYFQTKQDTEEGDHAEVVLMQEMDQYLKDTGIDPATCRIRITINNAPCGTGGKKEKNCAGKLQVYAKKFKQFRIYYMRPFGTTMEKSVKGMQKAGIKVSNFSPSGLGLNKEDYTKETWKKIQKQRTVTPDGVELDPWSSSEDEKEEGVKAEKKRTAPKSKVGKGGGSQSKAVMEESSSDSGSDSEAEKQVKEKVEKKRAAPKSKAGKRKKGGKSKEDAPKPASKRKGDDPHGDTGGKKKARKGKDKSATDSRYISLDDFDIFEDVAVELTHENSSTLNGYQVARLLQIFDGEPIGKYVTINGETFRISKSSKPLAVTEYNPTGLGLVIRRHLRGG